MTGAAAQQSTAIAPAQHSAARSIPARCQRRARWAAGDRRRPQTTADDRRRAEQPLPAIGQAMAAVCCKTSPASRSRGACAVSVSARIRSPSRAAMLTLANDAARNPPNRAAEPSWRSPAAGLPPACCRSAAASLGWRSWPARRCAVLLPLEGGRGSCTCHVLCCHYCRCTCACSCLGGRGVRWGRRREGFGAGATAATATILLPC